MLRAALAGVCLCFFYLTLLPEPLVIQAREGEATIFFASNRHYLLLLGECVTLHWDVQQIQAVYLNGQGQVGSGTAQQCLGAGDTPELRVVFQDGTEQRYRLDIVTLSTSLLGYALLVAVLSISALLFTSQWNRLRASNWRGAIRVVRCTLLVFLIVVLFWIQGHSLSQTIAAANWPAASQALKELFMIAGVLAIALLILPHTTEKLSTQSGFSILSARWLIGGGAVLTVVGGTILYVNPRGMYFNDAFEPNQLLLRDAKTRAYLALPATPDVVVLGSSRAFTLSPTDIQNKTGYPAFNMAVEGGRIEDMLIQTRLILDERQQLPKVLLLEVQEGLPREPNDIAERAPYSWIRYMPQDTALLTLQRRFERLFDLNQFAEAVYIERYNALYTREPKEWPQFNADGSAERPPRSASELEYALQIDIGGLQPLRCDNVNPNSQDTVNQMIQIADKQHSSLIFYISPMHPRYVDNVLRNNAEYQRCHNLFNHYMGQLTSLHPNVFFLDYSSLSSIHGDASEKGYYDAQHITRENAALLIQTAAGTIKHAHSIASH
jgi:hypothetical protein